MVSVSNLFKSSEAKRKFEIVLLLVALIIEPRAPFTRNCRLSSPHQYDSNTALNYPSFLSLSISHFLQSCIGRETLEDSVMNLWVDLANTWLKRGGKEGGEI